MRLASYLLLIAVGLPLSGRAATLVVPTQYPTIQAAIDAAQPLDVVMVEPGTYRENIVLRGGIDVIGRETSRTMLAPQSGQLPAVRIRIANDVRFSSFTVIEAETGVEVVGSIDVEITNVAFDSASSIALDVDDAAVEIRNNVFFDNALAIRRDSIAAEVINNIFRSNTVTIRNRDVAVDNNINVQANCWSSNDDLGLADSGYGTQITRGDPLFVDEQGGDFHLKQGSPCIDVGQGTDVIDNTVADVGAYGGNFADARPLPVTGLTLADSSSGGAVSITATWAPNQSYLVTHSTVPGGYKLYYEQNQSGAPYTGTDAGGGTQPSPIAVGTTTATLANLAPVRPRAGATQLVSARPFDQAVTLEWSAVPSATGYRVHYGVDSTAEAQVDAGNVTSFTVTGLTNGTPYHFAVGTLTQATYYVAVTARDSTPSQHESVYSEERSISVGVPEEAPLSNELMARPDRTVAYPVLPDEGGCFIATAAYGADWGAEVQALRDFRDRYLLGNVLGRWFVKHYYALSPAVADQIREHPSIKPVVRVLLTPLVLVALFLLGSGTAAKVTIAGLFAALAVRRYRRRASTMAVLSS
jgi:hypothetical protein